MESIIGACVSRGVSLLHKLHHASGKMEIRIAEMVFY